VSTLENSVTNLYPSGKTILDQRVSAIKTAPNPLLEASRVLLRALADMPAKLSADAANALRNLLMQEVRVFDLLSPQANIRSDHILGAKYCLCTALDEAAMSAAENNSVASIWAVRSLATAFLEDSKGGDKVYLLIARLLADPVEHRDLLEVIYRILSLGFEGRYRREADGQRKHDAIRQRLYEVVTAGREPPPTKLSPHWQTAGKGRRLMLFSVPVWISAVAAALFLLGVFAWFSHQLSLRRDDVQKQIAEIGRLAPLVLPPLALPVSPAPPVLPPALHLKQLLSAEIAAGLVSVDEDDHHSAVVFRGDEMFASGDATVKVKMVPLIAKIANEIAKVPGSVMVLGYTDNVPVSDTKAYTNQSLSEERAAQVLQLLQATGVPSDRLQSLGKGDADPVGDNATAEGRARNRRVEIVVTQ
jgi:type VI secretion system protein ImpK